MRSSGQYVVWSVVVIWTVCQLVLGTSVKLELAYHNREAAWNTASNVCRGNGGQLVKVSTRAKSNVVRHFHQTATGNFRNRDFWIGLFDKDIPNQVFSWTDCSPLIEDTFQNWEIGNSNPEPNRPDFEHCIRCRKNDYVWKTLECSTDFHFVCEKPVGECTFSTLERKTIESSLAYTTTALPDTSASLENCQAKCVGGDNPDGDCWAVTYIATGSGSGDCFLHLSDDPTQLMSPPISDDSYATSSIRECYEATYVSDSIPNNLKDQSDDPGPCVDNTPNVSELVEVSTSQTTSQSTADMPSVTPRTSNAENPTSVTTTAPSVASSQSSSVPTVTSPQSSSVSTVTSPQSSSVSTVTSPQSSSVSTVTSPQSSSVSTVTSTQSSSVSTVTLSQSSGVPTATFQQSPGISAATSPQSNAVTGATAQPSATTGVTGSSSSRDGHSQVVSSTEPVGTESRCRCPCSSTLTPAQSEKLIATILEDLYIEKKNISSHRRKYVSAADPRPSAQTIGCLGAVLLGLVFGGLVLLDLPRFLAAIHALVIYLREK